LKCWCERRPPTSSYIEQGGKRRLGDHKGMPNGLQISKTMLLQTPRHFGKERRRGRKKRWVKRRELMARQPLGWPADQPSLPLHFPLLLKFKLVP
jgi:hypothetical protein